MMKQSGGNNSETPFGRFTSLAKRLVAVKKTDLPTSNKSNNTAGVGAKSANTRHLT
ncbi:MAG: hypothetical protein ACYDBB_11390 [Armatimonadota bacterium]